MRRQTLTHYEWKGNDTKGANIKWKLLLYQEKRRKKCIARGVESDNANLLIFNTVTVFSDLSLTVGWTALNLSFSRFQRQIHVLLCWILHKESWGDTCLQFKSFFNHLLTVVFGSKLHWIFLCILTLRSIYSWFLCVIQTIGKGLPICRMDHPELYHHKNIPCPVALYHHPLHTSRQTACRSVAKEKGELGSNALQPLYTPKSQWTDWMI